MNPRPTLRPPKETTNLQHLRRKRPEDTETAWADPQETTQNTQTAWVDPWEATQDAREVVMGRQITDAINADPAEVEILRKAREQVRAGRRHPRQDAS